MIGLFLAYLTPFVHPSSFRILPFFGLAYPVIILLSLFLLIGWSLARSKYALFILLAIVIGGKLHFRLWASGSDTAVPNDPEKVWKVMSYNVRLFDLYNWYENKETNKRLEIFKYLKENNPDVLCFQEFYQQDHPSEFPTRDSLIPYLGMKDYHERYSYKLYGRQNFGISMFSKYPMIAKGEVTFQYDDVDSDNYCIYADIVKGKDTLRVYNIHLQSIKFRKDDYAAFEADENYVAPKQSAWKALYEKLRIAYPRRADQAKRVMKHANSSPYPVIICGDFNDTPMSYVYNQFNNSLIDAFRKSGSGIGNTYVGRIPAGRIDYIFHSDQLVSTNFKIQKQALSDHRAISCLIWQNEK